MIIVGLYKIMLSFSRELNVKLRSIEANMAPPKNDLMSMRLSNYGPNVKQCQHPSKKRPKKLVTSLTCQVFFSVPPSHISHIFYYFQSSISRITDVQGSPIGKIGRIKFGVFLAEPFSALSFPCPRFPLFLFLPQNTLLFRPNQKIFWEIAILRPQSVLHII